MDDFFGLGGFMGAPAATQPKPEEVEQRAGAWKSFLTNPATQAALLNFGTALMTPRWTPGSALPDALNAGARTLSTIEDEEYKRNKVEEDKAFRSSEAAANRSNQMKIAQLGADSRSEVAQIRMAGMLDAANVRAAVQGRPKTAQDIQFYQRNYLDEMKKLKEANENNKFLQRPVMTDQEMIDKANLRAEQALSHWRANFGSVPGAVPDAGAIPGEKTSIKPGAAAPPVGPGGAPQAPKSTSINQTPQTGITSADALKRFQPADLERIIKDPRAIEILKSRVSDPDALEAEIQMLKSRKQSPGFGR